MSTERFHNVIGLLGKRRFAFGSENHAVVVPSVTAGMTENTGHSSQL